MIMGVAKESYPDRLTQRARALGALLPCGAGSLLVAGLAHAIGGDSLASRELWLLWLTALAAGGAAMGVSWRSSRRVALAGEEIIKLSEALATGQLGSQAPAAGSGELGRAKDALVAAMSSVADRFPSGPVDWDRVRGDMADLAGYRAVVEGSATAMMLLDRELTVTRANPAALALVARCSAAAPAAEGDSATGALVGVRLDVLPLALDEQRRMLESSANLPFRSSLQVAGRELELHATAVVDPHGESHGICLEWSDLTDQRNADAALQGMLASIRAGELRQRARCEEMGSFAGQACAAMNEILDTILDPMDRFAKVVRALESGDLTERMSGQFSGEIGAIQSGLNSSLARMSETVDQLRVVTEGIGTGAAEIAKGASQLSGRIEQQASSLEETAASLEELTSTVKQNADNAAHANQLAGRARIQAEEGGTVVSKAIGAMSEIHKSSKQISEIIRVIDEIAFQTNLLALNASVEAARAGEQGRGFAVVASEVRNLAQRSAGAAKEINALIADSVSKVEEGSRLVDESGETLTEIVKSVKKVSDIIAEISAASQEQSSGVEQVNLAVMQMDSLTQQNASAVEQCAAASASMESQASTLGEIVSFFSLNPASVSTPAGSPSGQSGAAPRSEPGSSSGNVAARAPAPAAGSARPATTSETSADDDVWKEF